MRKLFLVFFSILFTGIYSCDDGDIITVSLDFEEEFQACDGISGLVISKTKDDPSESMSVFISNYKIENLLNVGEDNTFTETKSGTFNYRTYSNARISNLNLFCTDVPDGEIIITRDDDSSCTVTFSTVLTFDDNDGIPSELEDLNGNGDLEDDDTDGDGIPNYKDLDDDGDNVPTKDENPDPNGDGDFSDAQNTNSSEDDIPDYLDNDDDGDGVLTINEETANPDNNPANDVTNEDVGPDYLNPAVTTSTEPTAFRTHTVSKSFLVTATVFSIDLVDITQQELDFGILNDTEVTATEDITPPFN